MLESKQCLAYTLFLKVLSPRRVDVHLLISIVVLGFLLTSCAAIRGYFKDGKDGRVYQRVKKIKLKEHNFRLYFVSLHLQYKNRCK